MRTAAYPAYKTSGVEWLGDVPVHWDVRRTKTLLKHRNVKGFPDEPLLAATQTKGVVRKEHYENRTVLALKDLHLLKLVRVGDFVISLRSFQGGIEYAREQGIISPAYTILYPANPDVRPYLAWLFKSRPYIGNLTLHVTGIRQGQNIDYSELSCSYLPVPPVTEQAAIVRYLDHVDRRIRRYASAKRKLIALLEEEKQAVINQAVTRGLDPNVRLKSSGVEWLGDVPEHWEVVRLSSVARPKKITDQCNRELLSVYLNRGVVRFSDIDERRANPTSEDVSGYQAVDPSDFVLNNQQAWRGSVGVSDLRGIVSPAYLVLDLNRMLYPRFANLLFRDKSMVGQYVICSKGVGTIQRNLYWPHLKSIVALVPPLPEQAAIVGYLDKATADIDASITRARRQIELIEEYRTRLIADVVTGKLDVREAAARLPDQPDDADGAAEDVAGELARADAV